MTQRTSAATAGATRDVTTRQSHEFWGKAEAVPQRAIRHVVIRSVVGTPPNSC